MQKKQIKKMLSKIIKKTIAAILLVLPAMVCNSQNEIMVENYFSTEYSIMRETTRGELLLFNHSMKHGGYFVLLDNLSSSYLIAMTPGLFVNDMEIVANNAYFCGTLNGNPVSGFFGITALFYASGQITYFAIPSTLTCPLNQNDNEYITSLDKLEVIDFGGNNHLVMVGDASCTHTGTTNRCIVEIYKSGTPWIIAYQPEHGGVFHYDDIAITSTEIAIVGNKNGSNGEYISTYNIPTIYTNMFIATLGNINTYGYGGAGYAPYPTSKVIAENIPGTSLFATVCKANRSTSSNPIDATFFNLYSSVGNSIYRCFIDDYCGLNYRELKYNSSTNSFMLLMDSCGGVYEYGYYEFELDNTMSMVTNVYYHHNNSLIRILSLDKMEHGTVGQQCALSGNDPNANYLSIWRHDATQQQYCSSTYIVPQRQNNQNTGVFDFDCPDYYSLITPTYLTPTKIEEITLTTKCAE